MPGGGQNRKPAALHVLQGTYRPDRHGPKEAVIPVGPKPRKPQHLKGDAADAWQHLVGNTPPGIYGKLDTPLLTMCCELWAWYRQARATGNVPLSMKIADQFLKVSAKLGATPIDRGRLRMDSLPEGPRIVPRTRA